MNASHLPCPLRGFRTVRTSPYAERAWTLIITLELLQVSIWPFNAKNAPLGSGTNGDGPLVSVAGIDYRHDGSALVP